MILILNLFSSEKCSSKAETEMKQEENCADEHSEVKLDPLLIVMCCILSRSAGSRVSKLQLQTRLTFQALLTCMRPGSQDCHQRSSRGSRRVAREFEEPPFNARFVGKAFTRTTG